MKKRVISIILSVCMLISGISIGSLPTKAAETTNVALGKAAYASTDLSEWGAGASKLTDGDKRLELRVFIPYIYG